MERIISVDALKKSVSNVRMGHTKEDIAVMANSIKHRGIINAPTVALNGDGKYEVIAGQLRVAGAIAAGLTEIRCEDVSDLEPAQRVELSLSENIDRAAMTAIEKFKAFHQLFKAGVSVDDIAEKFSTTTNRVQQLLAIGGLPKPILELAESGEINDTALEAMAVAPLAKVKEYMKLKPDERPKGWNIKQWLRGQHGWYNEDAAFFDLELYKGGKIIDMFNDDQVMLTDGEEFWRLQKEAIDAEITKLTELGWKVFEIDYWQPYGYDKASKKDGGEVYYTVHEQSGYVEFHKGYKRKGKAGKQAATKQDGAAEPKPEISKAFEILMEETRHAAVVRHMVDGPKAALAPTIMLLLTQADSVRFNTNGGGSYRIKAEGPAVEHCHSDNFLVVNDAFDTMCKELGVKRENLWQTNRAKLLKKLNECTPATLLRYLATTMAVFWNIDYDAKTTDIVGKGMGLKQVNIWEPGDAFWKGINNKQTLIEIIQSFGKKIPVDEKMTLKELRKVASEQRPDDWRPKWLKF